MQLKWVYCREFREWGSNSQAPLGNWTPMPDFQFGMGPAKMNHIPFFISASKHLFYFYSKFKFLNIGSKRTIIFFCLVWFWIEPNTNQFVLDHCLGKLTVDSCLRGNSSMSTIGGILHDPFWFTNTSFLLS